VSTPATDEDFGLDVRELMEEAAAMARGGDETGAVARLRLAERFAVGDEVADVALALGRALAREKSWRAEIVRREAVFDARERAEASQSVDVGSPAQRLD